MSVDSDFRSLLIMRVPSDVPVQQNYLSSDQTQPRVYFGRAGAEGELLLSGATLWSNETTYTVEVAGLDPDAAGAIAEVLSRPAPAGIDGFRGPMGTTIFLGCFVGAASDDYEPRGVDLDDGYHVFAFEVRVMT